MISGHSAGELRIRAIDMPWPGSNRTQIHCSQQVPSVAGRDSAAVKCSKPPESELSPAATVQCDIPDAPIDHAAVPVDSVIGFDQGQKIANIHVTVCDRIPD